MRNLLLALGLSLGSCVVPLTAGCAAGGASDDAPGNADSEVRSAPGGGATTPAAKFVAAHRWLVNAKKGPVAELRAAAADTVEVIVSGDDIDADAAAQVLEPAVAGVKLVARTRGGHIGEDQGLSGDELHFASSLPGLRRGVGELGFDVDEDGRVGEDEAAFVFPILTNADGARLDPLVRAEINGLPVVFTTEDL